MEINLIMVNQLHNFFLAHLHSPFSLLINKVNAYSYDFEAQINIGNLSEIHAIAVIVYKIASQLNTEYLAHTIPRTDRLNLRIYSDRDVALNWLQLEQAQLS
ncbi:hypothetical protein [Colwellia sp. TT2012]|uniref:hypothetical protein n=1 Tax=Colwellia sp. TT2012 TaxID=1720342 RepID=UPI001E60DCC1|nr:hypothetical protein [Colwellia sp. TT2012]